MDFMATDFIGKQGKIVIFPRRPQQRMPDRHKKEFGKRQSSARQTLFNLNDENCAASCKLERP